MNNKGSYLYILSGTADGSVELIMKTPTINKVTNLKTLDNEEAKEVGMIGVYELNRIIRVIAYKIGDCWYFGVGKVNDTVVIPKDWALLIREGIHDNCSTALYIRSKSAIAIHPL